MRTLAVPSDPVARLWHAATMLAKHRCDGHIALWSARASAAWRPHVLSALAQASTRRVVRAVSIT